MGIKSAINGGRFESLEEARRDLKTIRRFGLRHGPSCTEYHQPKSCSCGVQDAYARLLIFFAEREE
jgi:hypothetical protein